MAYTRNPEWQPGIAGGTPVTAAKLNHIEQGVEGAAATADAAQNALAGKANTSHGHTAADVSDFAQAGDARWQRSLGAVNAATYGVTADGTTDDKINLEAAFAAAKVVILPAGTIRLSGKVAIPAGTTLITRGTSFLGATATGDFLLSVASNSTIIGGLRVTVAAGANVRGVEMAGDNIDVDAVLVSAPAAGAGAGDINDCALTLTGVTDSRVGRVEVANFDYPVKLDGCGNVTLSRVDLSTYVRGVYLKDCTDVTIAGGVIAGASPNAAVSPGHNGILIESVTAAGSTSDVTVRDVRVSDAGEHGYRVGGSLTARRLRFDGCTSSNTGGCGFKVLGDALSKHEDVILTDCVVEDAAQSGTNGAAFMLQYIKRAKVNGAIVRKRAKTYSASEGFNIQGAEEVTVTDPDISDVATAGFAVRPNLGNCTNVLLNGGRIVHPTGTAGILIDYTGVTFRRVGALNFPQVEPAAGGSALSIVNTAGGAIVGTPWVEWQSVAAAADQVAAGSSVAGYCIVARAAFGTPPVFKAGSQWIDGGLRISSGSAWVVK